MKDKEKYSPIVYLNFYPASSAPYWRTLGEVKLFFSCETLCRLYKIYFWTS